MDDHPVPSEQDDLDTALEEAQRLMDIDGVEGVGQGATGDGAPAILVMVAGVTDEIRAQVPSEIVGIPVEIIDIGERPTAFGDEIDLGEHDCG